MAYIKKQRRTIAVNPFDFAKFQDLCKSKRMSVSTAINLFILEELAKAGIEVHHG